MDRFFGRDQFKKSFRRRERDEEEGRKEDRREEPIDGGGEKRGMTDERRTEDSRSQPVKKPSSPTADDWEMVQRPSPTPPLARLIKAPRGYPSPFHWQIHDLYHTQVDRYDWSELIPKNKPAWDQDLRPLKRNQIEFGEPILVGNKNHSDVWACFYQWHKRGATGRELAVKRDAINIPLKRSKMKFYQVEQRLKTTYEISEILTENWHDNVVRHELVWPIRNSEITYKYPIAHLIFMERCDGHLGKFCVDTYGYSVQRQPISWYYKGMPDGVIKILVKHVAAGLDFLHDDMDKSHPNYKQAPDSESWFSIIHHNLHHENILYQIRGDGIKFLIADFNESEYKILPTEDDNTTPRLSKSLLGAKRFLAPEVIEYHKYLTTDTRPCQLKPREERYYDGRKKDVYALGVMMSDCLVGLSERNRETNFSCYQVGDEWLKNSLSKGRIKDYHKLKASPKLLDLMFKMAQPNPEKRPLASKVLKHEWLNDHRLMEPFVNLKSMSEKPELKKKKLLGIF